MAGPLALWKARTSKLQEQAPPIDTITAHDWVWPAYKYLREFSIGIQTPEEIHELTGVDLETGQRFCERAQYLFSLPSGVGDRHRMQIYHPGSRSSDPARRLVCPASPEGPEDKDVVESLAQTLSSAARDQRTGTIVAGGLESYAHSVWYSRGIAVFRDPDKPERACDFVKMLEAIGIERGDILWYCFKSDPAERSKFLPRWKEMFEINWRNSPKPINPPNRKSNAPEKWFGIAPRLDRYIAKIQSKSPGIFGFRFLMLMGFIVLSKTPLPTLEKDRSRTAASKSNEGDVIAHIEGQGITSSASGAGITKARQPDILSDNVNSGQP
jgi:hypothetical protein